MLAMLKTKTPTEPSFEESRAAFMAEKALWEAPNAELEALKVAQIWNGARDPERESDRFAWAREKMKQHWGEKRLPAAWRMPDLAREINERIELAHPGWLEAQRVWEHARSRETSRLALALQSRQRAIVRKIADAVEKLSDAMAEERSLHRELARTSPNGVSAYLEHCSPAIAGVEDHTGALFAWRKKMHNLKLLD